MTENSEREEKEKARRETSRGLQAKEIFALNDQIHDQEREPVITDNSHYLAEAGDSRTRASCKRESATTLGRRAHFSGSVAKNNRRTRLANLPSAVRGENSKWSKRIIVELLYLANTLNCFYRQSTA
jgi:endonuclease IV